MTLETGQRSLSVDRSAASQGPSQALGSEASYGRNKRVVSSLQVNSTVALPKDDAPARTEGYWRRPVSRSVVEQFYECVVEELEDDRIRLHTKSLSGEEAVAWLRFDQVPESELRHIEVGAPVRIAVVLTKDQKTHRRVSEIRVLRQEQWKAPVTSQGADRIAEFILRKMREAVSSDNERRADESSVQR